MPSGVRFQTAIFAFAPRLPRGTESGTFDLVSRLVIEAIDERVPSQMREGTGSGLTRGKANDQKTNDHQAVSDQPMNDVPPSEGRRMAGPTSDEPTTQPAVPQVTEAPDETVGRVGLTRASATWTAVVAAAFVLLLL